MADNGIGINRELIARLGAMDDESLKGLIRRLAQAAGADEKKTERALANIKTLRRRAMRMSDGELQKLADDCDKDKVSAALDELKRLKFKAGEGGENE